MKVVVIDGQGGKLGQAIVENIKKEDLNCDLYAIGTNSAATTAMLKAGADLGATGENPVITTCRDADVIIGPIGIISADSMLGEISPAMAVAVGQSRAEKLLLPVNQCKNKVVGIQQLTLSETVKETVKCLKTLIK